MTDDEHEMIKQVHEFLFRPPGPKREPRAVQIDQALEGIRTGKVGVRAALWLCGAAVAVMATYNQFFGGKP